MKIGDSVSITEQGVVQKCRHPDQASGFDVLLDAPGPLRSVVLHVNERPDGGLDAIADYGLPKGRLIDGVAEALDEFWEMDGMSMSPTSLREYALDLIGCLERNGVRLGRKKK